MCFQLHLYSFRLVRLLEMQGPINTWRVFADEMGLEAEDLNKRFRTNTNESPTQDILRLLITKLVDFTISDLKNQLERIDRPDVVKIVDEIIAQLENGKSISIYSKVRPFVLYRLSLHIHCEEAKLALITYTLAVMEIFR